MLVLDDPDGAAGLVDHAVANERAASPVVVLMTRASQTDLGIQILRSLGKRTELAVRPNRADTLWQNVHIWLDVLPIEQLTIANSDFLVPETIPRLASLRNVRLLLIHDQRGATSELNAALRDYPRPDPTFITETPEPDKIAAASEQPTGTPFPACPTDAFPFFLPTCHSVLPGEQYATVERAYTAIQDQVRGAKRHLDDPEPHETAAQTIRELLEPVADSHHRLALARGIEHAFFDAGWLLRIDPVRFMQGTATMPLSEKVSRVNWYSNCEFAATAALASIGLDSAGLSILNADAVFQQSGDSLSIPDEIWMGSPVAIPRPLTPPLRAFWADQHASIPPPNTGPLFRTPDGDRLSPKAIKTRLSRIALETGLPVASHWTPPADQRATQWMRRHGITLSRL